MTAASLSRDRLFVLKPGFEDPAYPGRIFYCWHCAVIEGVIALFPAIASTLDVERLAWSRPRAEIVALLGVEHQSLPVMILADGASSSHATGHHEGRVFADRVDAILSILAERHGTPLPHP